MSNAAIDFDKKETLKVVESVRLFESLKEAAIFIKAISDKPNPSIISFINAHAFNLCFTSVGFSTNLMKSDVILRDGVGMEILYRSLGRNPGANLNGTDFIPVLLQQFAGKKIAILGTEEPYLSRAVQMLFKKGHDVVLFEDGFQSPQCYLSLVKAAVPDVIILGMGMPKQERVAVMLKENLQSCSLIINGGAIIDFWGNKVRRAPLWIRQLKMEWIYRLVVEPQRLFTRYVIGNYAFLKRTRELKKQKVTNFCF